MSKVLGCDIRWLIRRDMEEVLDIEQTSFEFPWSEQDFMNCLRQRNCIGTVAVAEDKILGFMIYEPSPDSIRLINFAVPEKNRRAGVGSRMVQRVKDRLSQQRRREIVLEVRESNVPAQLFFAASDFKAIEVLRNHYDDTNESAYVMRYRLKSESKHVPHNRIKGL